MSNTMSQKAAREGLGNPELFKGGVFVTKNGQSELFIQTSEEREIELKERERERQANALLKLVMAAKDDVKNKRILSPEEALEKLRAARK
ncbi:hypothetical protein AB6F64_18395 [Providencia hangzhouensis]|uniref:Uncharacterized protein n=1 Tax=Providencia rettgeri TaxID=587 RepID=A0AAE2ZA29_PRORE|nr:MULTISPECIES: hypothetical protein [Providencia]EHZ6871552.1 hypothetical protein [Providencia rettgeri]MBG5893926.1 hypothetical protein [Providencia rettgeri]MBJ9969988.1 hypothetical protein [Providencia rettgeri]MBQ0530984.1 hypothetical protein [Providencia rettgeri]MBW3115572.1 hypothetical protein [Providencia rettgeri]